MARLAMFIDAAYANKLANDTFNLWIDYEKFSRRLHKKIAAHTAEPLDLLRTYYYDCLPIKKIRRLRSKRSGWGRREGFTMPSETCAVLL